MKEERRKDGGKKRRMKKGWRKARIVDIKLKRERKRTRGSEEVKE